MAFKLNDLERDILGRMKAYPEYASEFLEELSTRPLCVQLVTLRRLMGWTQARLAKELGLKQTHVSRLENPAFEHRTKLFSKAAERFGARLAFIPRGARIVPGPEFLKGTHSAVAEPRRPYRARRKAKGRP